MSDVTHRLSAEGADPLALAGVNDRNLQELERATGARVSMRGDHVTLAGAIESARPQAEVEALIGSAMSELCTRLESGAPDRALLGCTHFAIVEPLFRRALPARTRLLSQPDAVADSLEDYLVRHPAYAEASGTPGVRLLTTGAVAEASRTAAIFWPGAPLFERL